MIGSTYQLEEGKPGLRQTDDQMDWWEQYQNDSLQSFRLTMKNKGLNSCRVGMVRIALRWSPGWNQIPIADILWTRDFSSREKTRKKRTIVSYNSAVLDILTLQSHLSSPDSSEPRNSKNLHITSRNKSRQVLCHVTARQQFSETPTSVSEQWKNGLKKITEKINKARQRCLNNFTEG